MGCDRNSENFYTFKFEKGSATASFGLYTARKAGLDQKVIELA